MSTPLKPGECKPPDRSGAVPGARWAVFLLIAISLFNYIDRQVLAAVVPYVREAFFAHGTPHGFAGWLVGLLQPLLGAKPENAMIGLLAMAFMVTYMVLAPLFGLLRIKRWWIIGFGVVLWTIASGASGLAMTFGALLLTRCFVGVGEAAYGPVAPDIISDLYPASQRGKVLSWFYMAIPVGSALGYVLGGLVASTLGWRWAFYAVVPPGILLGLWSLFMRDPKRGNADAMKDSSAESHKASLKDYKRFLKNKSYVLCTLGGTAMTFAIGGIAFWIPDYIHEFRGVANLAQVNLTFGLILVVSGLLGTLAGGMIGDKLKARYSGSYFLVSGAAMIVAFPFFVAMLYVPFPWAWVCIAIGCFCLFFNTGPSNAILANVTHPALRASAFALNILVIHAFGDVISPLVIGAITDATGKNMNIAFLVVSVLVLVGGIIWLFGAKHLARDEQRALDQLKD
ncbi:MAG TPA: MFS transporter [Planktothrix sp.]|jgi:MFS family permease